MRLLDAATSLARQCAAQMESGHTQPSCAEHTSRGELQHACRAAERCGPLSSSSSLCLSHSLLCCVVVRTLVCRLRGFDCRLLRAASGRCSGSDQLSGAGKAKRSCARGKRKASGRKKQTERRTCRTNKTTKTNIQQHDTHLAKGIACLYALRARKPVRRSTASQKMETPNDSDVSKGRNATH